MDSRVVNQKIRSEVWPALKAKGFSTFTSRTAWRYQRERINVLNFQSFNRYNADVIGTTTFSFCVNLGCHVTYILPQFPPKSRGSILLPAEYECQFRGRLLPTIPQVANRHIEANRIWMVDWEGNNLNECIHDVVGLLPTAFQWYKRLNDDEEIFRILSQEDEDVSGLWGFGRNPSPFRSYMAGYAALHLGKKELACEKLGEAVRSQCFQHLFTSVEEAFSRADAM